MMFFISYWYIGVFGFVKLISNSRNTHIVSQRIAAKSKRQKRRKPETKNEEP